MLCNGKPPSILTETARQGTRSQLSPPKGAGHRTIAARGLPPPRVCPVSHVYAAGSQSLQTKLHDAQL
eukprot:7385245-Prymnesium_polylepis.1